MIACPDRYKMDIPDLIQKAKEHDSDAFDIIYKQYHPRMMGVCMNIVKEDRATVEDLVHDAFILAFVSIGQLRDGARLGEWLTTIVRNVALKHVEQRNRLQTMPLSAVNEEDAAFIDTSSSPETDDIRLLDDVRRNYPSLHFFSLCQPNDNGYNHQSFCHSDPHTKQAAITRLLLSVDILLRSHTFVGSITTGPSVFIMKVRHNDHTTKAIDCPTTLLPSALCQAIDIRSEISRQTMANE